MNQRGLAEQMIRLAVQKTGLALHYKGALTPNWDDVRTCVRTCMRAQVTLGKIVYSVSRGRIVTRC